MLQHSGFFHTCDAVIPYEHWLTSCCFMPATVPDSVSEKAAEEGLSTQGPATHVGDLHGIRGSWLRSCSAVVLAAIWGSELVDERSLFLSFSRTV